MLGGSALHNYYCVTNAANGTLKQFLLMKHIAIPAPVEKPDPRVSLFTALVSALISPVQVLGANHKTWRPSLRWLHQWSAVILSHKAAGGVKFWATWGLMNLTGDGLQLAIWQNPQLTWKEKEMWKHRKVNTHYCLASITHLAWPQWGKHSLHNKCCFCPPVHVSMCCLLHCFPFLSKQLLLFLISIDGSRSLHATRLCLFKETWRAWIESLG